LGQGEGSNQPSNDGKEVKHTTSKLWVPIIVIVGVFIGVLASISDSVTEPFIRGGFFPQYQIAFETFQEIHIILSTVGVALLVSLIIVYARTYIKTQANFIFGLLVVLFALLLQSLLTYPFLTDIFSPQTPPRFFSQLPPNFSSPFADVFMIIAYAVFLYLSLE